MYNPAKPYKRRILKLIQKTWQTPYVSIKEDVYPVIIKKFSYPEVDHTDGIGTKGIYHWQQGTFRNAVLDALAMNLNDLALLRAVPYKLQNHITIPKEDERVVKIIKALAKECVKRNIAITGGENSFHNDLEGLDISITVSGFIKGPKKQNKFKVGDTLIGIKSNGLHSNGFTKIRKVFGKKIKPAFTTPTRIYLDEILALDKNFNIHGMTHITGGAYTKLKDLLHGTDAIINRSHKLKPQPIFHEIHKRGIFDKEMYTTFNCGIGFILSVSPKNAYKVVSKIKGADVIGKIVPGNGKVKIESEFSKKNIEF